MIDYRLPENRLEYFDKLYRLNLDEKIMPGLVYLYFPALKAHFNWDTEQALWFAFLNGMTQNPLTSLRIFRRWPEPVFRSNFKDWFDANWDSLQFDTDRRYQKKDTPFAIQAYSELTDEYGYQEDMLVNQPFDEVWKLVTKRYLSFGRLAAWSYLEYVNIMAGGEDASNLMLRDKSGSKSHRNGLLLLFGEDHLVNDKRMQNGFNGEYTDFEGLCSTLEDKAAELVRSTPGASLFTLESNCCTFKNTFFGRRYPGVYADMAYERLMWYKERIGDDENTKLFWEFREALPDWLRLEAKPDGMTIKERGAFFPKTGYPYRGEYFL